MPSLSALSILKDRAFKHGLFIFDFFRFFRIFFGKFESESSISFFFFKNLAVENSIKNRSKTAGVSLLRSHLLRLQPLDN